MCTASGPLPVGSHLLQGPLAHPEILASACLPPFLSIATPPPRRFRGSLSDGPFWPRGRSFEKGGPRRPWPISAPSRGLNDGDTVPKSVAHASLFQIKIVCMFFFKVNFPPGGMKHFERCNGKPSFLRRLKSTRTVRGRRGDRVLLPPPSAFDTDCASDHPWAPARPAPTSGCSGSLGAHGFAVTSPAALRVAASVAVNPGPAGTGFVGGPEAVLSPWPGGGREVACGAPRPRAHLAAPPIHPGASSPIAPLPGSLCRQGGASEDAATAVSVWLHRAVS